MNTSQDLRLLGIVKHAYDNEPDRLPKLLATIKTASHHHDVVSRSIGLEDSLLFNSSCLPAAAIEVPTDIQNALLNISESELGSTGSGPCRP